MLFATLFLMFFARFLCSDDGNFQKYDVNKNGFLNYEEFRNLLSDKLIAQEKVDSQQRAIIEHELQNQNLPLGEIFNLVDSDRNGQISEAEFAGNKEVLDFFDQIDEISNDGGTENESDGEKEGADEKKGGGGLAKGAMEEEMKMMDEDGGKVDDEVKTANKPEL